MKLIREHVQFDDIEFLNEAKGTDQQHWTISGPFLQAEKKNRNGRVYSKQLIEREVAAYNKEYVATKSAYGELDHPPTPQLNLDRVSHICEALDMDGINGIGRARLLDTPMGMIAQKILAGGGRLGVSTRGIGTLKGENVNDDYKLLAIDIVANPSAPDAYVNGVFEAKEWILQGNTILEKGFDEFEATLNKKGSKEIAEALTKFLQFIKRG